MNRWTCALIATLAGVSLLERAVRRPGAERRARVAASEQSLIPLQTRLRFTTMIVLPDDEEILDVVCGDRDFWVISATQNIAHVKPAKAGAETNLNLVTASGAIYSFLLTEKSGPPDLKVYVEGNESAAPGQAAVLQRRAGRGAAGAAVGGARGRGGGRSPRHRGRGDLPAGLPDDAAVRVRHAQVREAVPRAIDLARRAVHVPEVRRHGTASAVRAGRRQAGARELPGAQRHLRRAEGARARLSGARQGAASRSRRDGDMAEQETPPHAGPGTDSDTGTVPVTDRRPVPQGVLPRGSRRGSWPAWPSGSS